MNQSGAAYPHQAITYTRGTTKVQALLKRLSEVQDALPGDQAAIAEANRTVATLTHEMRTAKRAFEANSRALLALDSLIDQVY